MMDFTNDSPSDAVVVRNEMDCTDENSAGKSTPGGVGNFSDATRTAESKFRKAKVAGLRSSLSESLPGGERRAKEFFTDSSDSSVRDSFDRVQQPTIGESTCLNFRLGSDDEDLLSRLAAELVASRDPNLTKETLVLRALKRISEGPFNLPWIRVLDTLRQGQCHFDRESHALLERVLELSALQREESVDRIVSRDYVKKSDVDRLATLLLAGAANSSSFEKNLPVCLLFAVDGFYGFHDLKLYGNHFKCCEEYKTRHVAAVRKLYRRCRLPDAAAVLRVLECAFGEEGEETLRDPREIEALEFYKKEVLPEYLPAARAWKIKERRQVAENLERARRAAEKKSRTEVLKKEKKKTDFAASSDADSDDDAEEKKRKREEKRNGQSAKKRKVEEKQSGQSAKKRSSAEEKVKSKKTAEEKVKSKKTKSSGAEDGERRSKKEKEEERKSKMEKEEERKSKMEEVVQVFGSCSSCSEDSDSDREDSASDREDVLKTLVKTASDFEERKKV